MTASVPWTGPATTTTVGHPVTRPAVRTLNARPVTTAPSAAARPVSWATRSPPADSPDGLRLTWLDSPDSRGTLTPSSFFSRKTNPSLLY